MLYFNIAVVFFLKSRRDGINEGIFEDTEQSFPGAKLRAINPSRNSDSSRHLISPPVFQQPRGGGDNSLADLSEEGLVAFLVRVVNVHFPKQRVDITVDLAVSDGKFGIEGQARDVLRESRSKERPQINFLIMISW